MPVKPMPKGQGHATPAGTIRVKLDDVARELGLVHKQGRYAGRVNYKALYNYLGVGLLGNATFDRVVRHPERAVTMHFNTLAKLCRALNCQPGDILEYIPAETALSDAYKRTEEAW